MSKHTIQLANGIKITIRPIRPQDQAAIIEMHQRLSPDSLYYRYLRPHRPTPEEIMQLCQLASGQGVAFVASLKDSPQKIIGLGYYVILNNAPYSGVAEPAILVEDEFQGQGVGRAIFDHLTRHALARQIQTFDLEIHPANYRMLQLVYRSGFFFQERLGYGARQVKLRLEPASAGRP